MKDVSNPFMFPNVPDGIVLMKTNLFFSPSNLVLQWRNHSHCSNDPGRWRQSYFSKEYFQQTSSLKEDNILLVACPLLGNQLATLCSDLKWQFEMQNIDREITLCTLIKYNILPRKNFKRI